MKFICLGCLDKEAWGRLSVGEQAALVVECTNFDQQLAAQIGRASCRERV